MIYEEIPTLNRDEYSYIISVGNSNDIVRAVISVALKEENWQWVQSQCVELSKHESSTVRSACATCFGHIVRLHRALDFEVVSPILKRLFEDEETKPYVQDTLDDIFIYMGMKKEEIL